MATVWLKTMNTFGQEVSIHRALKVLVAGDGFEYRDMGENRFGQRLLELWWNGRNLSTWIEFRLED